MLRIDLSALSQTELRRLLANAEDRGQTALAVQLQGELTARRAGGGGSRPPPAAFDDDDDTEPMVLPDHLPALSLAGRDGGAAPPGRRRPIGLLAFSLILTGAVAAWGLTGAPGLNRPPSGPSVRPTSAIAAPPPPPVQRAMVARVEPALPADVEAPAPPPSAPVRVATTARPEPPAPRRLDPCATPPTPADRALCNDLGLNLLEHEMREAYGRAMSAGADPARLRADQSAWRAERDPTSDPRTLARLYDRRIGELKALARENPPDDTP